MSIIDSLSPLKKKFFESIGIYSDADIPDSFFEVIRPLKGDFSESEKFCVGNYSTCFSSKSMFCMKDVVGTDHDRYSGRTWLEAFLDLDRGDKNLQLYFDNPEYYHKLQEGESDLGLAQKNNKFYILSKAGGGNNRLILMKIKYLALADKTEELSKVDRAMSFYANVRQVPTRETSDNIFNLMWPGGGFMPSGYSVVNKSDDPNIELYDIVTGFPMNTTVVASCVLGTEIDKVELESLHSIKK